MLAAVVAGCASGPPAGEVASAARAALMAAPLCCTSLAEAPRSPLPRQETLVPIDAGRPVFEFDGKRAYFVIYELPAYETPYSILVESRPGDASSTRGSDGAWGMTASKAKTLLMPGVLMLDAEFRPQRSYGTDMLRPRGDSLEQTVFVNLSNAVERYVALYGVNRDGIVVSSYSTVTSTPIVAGPYMFTMIGGQDQKSQIHYSPVGNLRVSVSGLTPKPAP